MPTTIQIDKDTLEMLKGYKEQLHANTYDELIKTMLIEWTKKSMFGFLGKKSNRKDILRGLRDESDRF